MNDPFLAHSEITNEIYIIYGKKKYCVTEQVISAMKATGRLNKRPQGEWIKDEDTGLIGCSCCHIVWLRGTTAYCPNCGADMRGNKK